jgi:hypothetical protein
MAWKINDEPAAVFGALGEVVRQTIPVLVLLGVWALSKEQLVGIMLAVSAAITFLTVVFTRQATVTNQTADKQIVEATTHPAGTAPQVIIDAVKAKDAA